MGIVRRSCHRRDRQVRRAGRHRRAHAHADAVRRHRGVRHVRDRHPRRGVGRRHDDRRLRRAEHRRQRAGRARRVARQGRRRVRDRLRVPPDHRWRRRGVAEGDDVPRRQRGHHELQAVHGLPGRPLLRRRPDPAGDAERLRVRGDDHDARRERHRHRRARRPVDRPRRHRSEVPLAHPARRVGGRGDAPGDRARQGRRQRAALHRAHVGLGGAGRGRRRAARRPQRVRRDVPAVPLPHARGPARRRPVSKAPSGCAPRRCAPSTPITRPTSGRACG